MTDKVNFKVWLYLGITALTGVGILLVVINGGVSFFKSLSYVKQMTIITTTSQVPQLNVNLYKKLEESVFQKKSPPEVIVPSNISPDGKQLGRDNPFGL